VRFLLFISNAINFKVVDSSVGGFSVKGFIIAIIVSLPEDQIEGDFGLNFA